MTALPVYPHPRFGFEYTSTKTAGLVFGSSMVMWLLLSVTEMVSVAEEIENDPESLAMVEETARDNEANKAKEKPKQMFVAVEANMKSIRLLLSHLSQFGLILWLSWLCENMPFFPHSKKYYERDWFIAASVIYFIAAACTREKQRDTSVLNRDQTEEWKGWMQFFFLLYHYYHASEVYNAVRVFISCYVWLTGFGNFSFFYTKADYGLVRLSQMLFRLNFLVFCLMAVHGNTYMLYYICPLHTFFFICVYVVMRIAPSLNLTKWAVRGKLAAFAAAVYVVWDCPGIFDLAFAYLPHTKEIGAKNGMLYEWHFRSALDHWDTLFGMIFALNYPSYSRYMNMLEGVGVTWKQHFGVNILVASLVVAATAVWYCKVFVLTKTDYNENHPYYFWIPLLSYIFLRNMTPWLRSWHLGLLREAGKITLETYLMQHHLWLTTNAKTLLTIVPGGYPKTNFLVTTIVYVACSYRLFRLTVSLRAMLIPTSSARLALRYICTAASVIGVLLAVAWILTAIHASNSMVVTAIVGVGCVGCIIVHMICSTAAQRRAYNLRYAAIGVGVVVSCLIGLCLMETRVAASLADANASRFGDAEEGVVPPTHGPGVAGSLSKGLIPAVAAGLMLLTAETYAGALHLATYACCVRGWSWESSYGDLNRNIRNRLKEVQL